MLQIDPFSSEIIKRMMTMEESTSSARRNLKPSRIAFLFTVLMVSMWKALLFLIILRIGGNKNIPIDYIVNASNMVYSPFILYT